MSWRTIIISKQAKLDYKMGMMVIRGEETRRVVVDEIATLVIENPAVSLTGCLIEALIEKKVKVIFCDAKRNPAAELLPHHGSHDSTAKIRTQAAWSNEVKGLVWMEIISEKIRKQAEFLEELEKGRETALLRNYIGQVEELDATNREGHAANKISAELEKTAVSGYYYHRAAELTSMAEAFLTEIAFCISNRHQFRQN